MIGKTVGKYRIVEQLGRGGMGVVYKAVDETLDREVAIKCFSAELEEQEVVKRFRAEATTLAKLNHSSIATIYELYRSDADLLMVMEYVSGETLEKLSQRSGPLPPQRAAYLVAQVLGALDYAHQAGIVHRDLKPANVMVNDQGHVKVMDFGIARVLGAEHTTLDGYMMGTPAYMAPEQVLGQEVDPRTDLYSVGVVFYRLLTGALPFHSETVIGMVQKQVSDQPTPARVHRADVPVWCEVVLTRALAKNPADRFQTAEEFRQALLAPVDAMATERTLPLGLEMTPQPAPASQVTDAPPTLGAVAPAALPAGPSLLPGGVSLASLRAAWQRQPVAIGGAFFGLLAVSVIALALWRGSRVPGAPAASVSGAELLSTSSDAQSAAATQVSVPAGTPLGVPELRRPGPGGRPTPAMPAPLQSQPGPAQTPSLTPSQTPFQTTPPLAARDVAPVTPSASAGGTPGRAPRAASAVPYAFEGKAVVKDGDKQREHDAKVSLSDGVITVTVRFDRTSETVLSAIPFGSLLSVNYSKSKQPLWTTPSGPRQVLRLDTALGFFKGDRHWLSLRTSDAFVVLRIDGDDVNSVLAAIEERTGRTVDHLVDRKDSK
jgi:predicted Ser/Thr protein kinase